MPDPFLLYFPYFLCFCSRPMTYRVVSVLFIERAVICKLPTLNNDLKIPNALIRRQDYCKNKSQIRRHASPDYPVLPPEPLSAAATVQTGPVERRGAGPPPSGDHRCELPPRALRKRLGRFTTAAHTAYPGATSRLGKFCHGKGLGILQRVGTID